MADKKKEITGMLAYVIAARELRASTVHRKCLIQYYASNTRADGSFFKSISEICAETGLCKTFVYAANTEWEKNGFLQWSRGNGIEGKANLYQLCLKKLQSAAEKSRKHVDAAKSDLRKKSRERQAKYRAIKSKLSMPQKLGQYVTPPHGVTVTSPHGVTA